MHAIRNESMYAKKIHPNLREECWITLAHSASNKPVVQESQLRPSLVQSCADFLCSLPDCKTCAKKTLTFSEFCSESESVACESLPLSSLMACTLHLPNPRAGREHDNALATAADSSCPWMLAGSRHSTHLPQCQRSQNRLNWSMLWSLSLQFKEFTRNFH